MRAVRLGSAETARTLATFDRHTTESNGMEVEMEFVVTVRGRLKGSREQAQAVHDATVAKISPQSREMGSVGHQAFLNPQDEKDFLAVDFWDNLEAIQQLYADPALAEEFGKLFDGQPEVVVWANSGWLNYLDAG